MTLDAEPTDEPTTRRQALTLLGTWASALGVVAFGLVLTLRELRPPQVWSGTSAWDEWASRHEPDDLVAAATAPVALLLVCVLAAVTLGAGVAVALATRRGRTVRCSSRWPQSVASFVAAVTLLSGGSAAASTGSGASAGGRVADRPLVELVEDAEPTSTVPPAPATSPPTTSTTTSTATSTTTSTTVASPTPTTSPPEPRSAQQVLPAAAAPPSASATVEVHRGDNLWLIAERQVAADPRRGPTLRYWLQLIDTNRSRFVEPGNPSLILPGQVLELPGHDMSR